MRAKTVHSENEKISDFKNHVSIATYTKPRSANSIKVVQDIDEPTFLYVLTYRTKTGLIVETNMIVDKDFQTWDKLIKSTGFIKEE